MLVGYARVSSRDQKPDRQLDALKEAGCEKVFVEKASGASRERPELRAALGYYARGWKGGHPRGMTDADLRFARTSLRDRAFTVADVARHLCVEPATLYRHIPGGRAALEAAQ
jgi:hypothetical protein